MAEPTDTSTSSEENTPRWRRLFGGKSNAADGNEEPTYRSKATLGILSDKHTDEVPGMNLSLSHCYKLITNPW